MKKKCFLLIMIIFYLLFIPNVNAAKLVCGDKYSGTRVNKKIGNNIVYCADKNKNISCSDSTYSEYRAWKNSTACSYGTTKDVDCSIMTGFVINRAKEAAKKLGKSDKYLFVQRAEQTYLKKYGGSWGSSNSSYLDKKAGGKTIKTVIAEAWDDYQKYKGSSSTSVTSSALKVSVSVDGNDNGLYYNSDKNAYFSYKITINITGYNSKNNLRVDLDADPDDNNSSVVVCKNKDCGNESPNSDYITPSSDYIVNGNDSFIVYLKTPKADVNNIKLVVTAKEIVSGNVATICDTKMYRSNNRSFQKLLMLENCETKNSKNTFRSGSGSINFTVYPVKLMNCSNLYPGMDTSTSINKTGGNGIKCQNNNATTLTDPKEYTADFKSCVMNKNKTISYASYKSVNGSCVNESGSATTSIAIGQQGEFTFGGVKGDESPKIFKGHGFYLLSNNTYRVGVSWKKAISYKNYEGKDISYFYLPNDGAIHHNTIVYSGSNCTGNSAPFDAYAREAISYISVDANKDFSKIFKTYVNETKEELVPSKVEVVKESNDISNLPENTLGEITYKFSTPMAYFDRNSKVYYENNNSDYQEAGNRYYVLLKYNGSTYPFNINKLNLSLINGISWNLDASCDIPVGDDCPEVYVPNDDGTYSLNVSYRPISVTNPFPKKTAMNWEEFEKSPTKMSRLAKTFDNKVYYEINFEGGNVSKISRYNTTIYNVFDNISDDGKSRVVTSDNGFHLDNNDSYCPLGYFDSSCDR